MYSAGRREAETSVVVGTKKIADEENITKEELLMWELDLKKRENMPSAKSIVRPESVDNGAFTTEVAEEPLDASRVEKKRENKPDQSSGPTPAVDQPTSSPEPTTEAAPIVEATPSEEPSKATQPTEQVPAPPTDESTTPLPEPTIEPVVTSPPAESPVEEPTPAPTETSIPIVESTEPIQEATSVTQPPVEAPTSIAEPTPAPKSTETSAALPEQTTSVPVVVAPPETTVSSSTEILISTTDLQPSTTSLGSTDLVAAKSTTSAQARSSAPPGKVVDQTSASSAAKAVDASTSQTASFPSSTGSTILEDASDDQKPTTPGAKLSSPDDGSLESFSSFIGSAGGSTFATSIRVPKATAIISTDAQGQLTTFLPSFTPLPAQAQAAQDQDPTQIGTGTDGTGGSGTGGGSSTLGVPTGTLSPGGGLNVIQSAKNNNTQTTIAISVSLIVAGVVLFSAGAYVFIRRYMRNRTVHADSPPSSPLINIFDAGRLPVPESPLPTSSRGTEMSENGFEKHGQMQGSETGNGTHGPLWPLDGVRSNPVNPGNDRGLDRNLSGARQRETMRIFPNGREKLGGKEFPSNF